MRTLVIPAVVATVVIAMGQSVPPGEASGRTDLRPGRSGPAAGASWFCHVGARRLVNAARIAPIDKLAIVLVAVFAVLFPRERLSTANRGGIAMVGAAVLLLAS